jgi:hypothetical protein
MLVFVIGVRCCTNIFLYFIDYILVFTKTCTSCLISMYLIFAIRAMKHCMEDNVYESKLLVLSSECFKGCLHSIGILMPKLVILI